MLGKTHVHDQQMGKTHDQHIERHWHVAEAFSPARPGKGTILNFHQVISIAINTSMVLNCALVTSP